MAKRRSLVEKALETLVKMAPDSQVAGMVTGC
jgi:hypothetical protein